MVDWVELSATLEDYLEAISRLIAEKGVARVRDIATALSVHKSTVTAALKSLGEKGLVNYSPYEVVTVTSQGRKVAKDILGRHRLIRRFLVDVLLLDEDMTDANACRMEHVMDEEVLERLSLFGEFVKQCPRAGEEWLGKFRYYFEHGGEPPRDESTLREWVEGLKMTLSEREEEGGKRPTMTTLEKLKTGQKGTIVRVGSAGPIKRRIVDMGVVRGTPVEVIKVAPLGDPIEIKVKGYNLSLRKEEAAAITVEPE